MTNHAQEFVDNAYKALAQLPGFTCREEQATLSHSVSKALLSGEPLCAEAPTGTGKTLAYLIGAIGASQASPRKAFDASEEHPNPPPPPVVVSTATVSLQEQVFTSDLHTLIKVGLVDQSQIALAKGRGRYFCPYMGQQACGYDKESERQEVLFEEDRKAVPVDMLAARELYEAWHKKTWNGELDDWPGRTPSVWGQVQSSRDTCIRTRCASFNQGCPFFTARRTMEDARIIVANHDLVLSDLMLRNESMNNSLLPFDHYFAVFDEGHHLPDKAIGVAATRANLVGPQEWLIRLPELAESLAKVKDLTDETVRKNWFKVLRNNDFLQALRMLSTPLTGSGMPEETTQVHKEVPVELFEQIYSTTQSGWNLVMIMRDLSKALKTMSERGRVDAEQAIPEAAFFTSRLENLVGAFDAYLADEPRVRWMDFKEKEEAIEVILQTSPIEGDDVLRRLLWNAKIPTVIVSATLRTLGDYTRFVQRAAVPSNASFVTIDHTFPYDQNEIIVPQMRNEPKQKGYEEELLANLTHRINPQEGTLIIFTSYFAMQRVIGQLPPELHALVLMQGSASRGALIEKHRKRIDAGLGSILVGVDSFSEGLDLPGDYCTHLIITKLPFGVPGNPLEQARREKAGSSHFMTHMLPDAALKLTQTVGRLMRRESDRGRITIFDKRLVTKRYGPELLNTLPPFRRVIENVA